MNKKDYIDAINEIKVGDNLKKETLNKIKEKKKFNGIYKWSSIAISLLIVISIGLFFGINNQNKISKTNPVIEDQGLPKVQTFDKLYEILKLNEANTTNMYKGTGIELDESIASTAQDSAQSITSTKENSNSEDYSKTNVQVEGVDESDIVKTDGNNIYYVNGDKIVIVDASNPKDLKIASEIKYGYNNIESFYPNELFIYDNKLIVIGTKSAYYNNNSTTINTIIPMMQTDSISPSYYNSSKQFTVAMVYNLQDKSNPTLEREVEIEGNYLSSRMIGENVYLISNKYIYTYLYDINKETNINEDDFKPLYKDTVVSQDAQSIGFDKMYYFPDSEDTSYLNIAGFNVNKKEEANIDVYLGAGQDIYASENNLYVTRSKYEYKKNIFTSDDYNTDTYIYKFKLNEAKITYLNSASVPGEVLNQFSMDEYDGYFRIATTTSSGWSSDNNRNNLYVLDENLNIIGKIEGLAKGEKIYSVRFMGKKAYIVTFVQTDPLFVIDLSQPANPTVLGELKIPGFSNYLHPYDETHIIGFGKDTKVVNYGYGDQVITQGMKMALFDVTDPLNPKELYSVKIGDSGTYSELLNNHKALLFSKEKNIIAFPITISQDVNDYRYNLRFQGAIIYGLDLDKGFTLKGQIAHTSVENGYMSYDYTKEVERIIYINNTLYTLSQGLIKSVDINTMEQLDEIAIEVNQTYYPYILN